MVCTQKDVEMHLPARIGDYTDFYLCEVIGQCRAVYAKEECCGVLREESI